MQVKKEPIKPLFNKWYKVIDEIDDIDEELGNLLAGQPVNLLKIENKLKIVQNNIREFKREYKDWSKG